MRCETTRKQEVNPNERSHTLQTAEQFVQRDNVCTQRIENRGGIFFTVTLLLQVLIVFKQKLTIKSASFQVLAHLLLDISFRGHISPTLVLITLAVKGHVWQTNQTSLKVLVSRHLHVRLLFGCAAVRTCSWYERTQDLLVVACHPPTSNTQSSKTVNSISKTLNAPCCGLHKHSANLNSSASLGILRNHCPS